jgi:hypothetical protein
MNLSQLVSRAIGSSEFFLKKNAPTILTGAGVAGFIATTALTIRATTKANDVLPVISDKIALAKEPPADLGLSEKEAQKNLVKVYVESALEVGKIYAPVFLVGSASIACVLAGHGVMLKRQANLAAAYVALDAAYKAYRSRVIEKIGAEEELPLYRNVRTVQSVGEDGDPCEIIDYEDTLPANPYMKFFDESSKLWSKSPDYNLVFLTSQQNYANDRLKKYGFLFLNEVYENLGFPRAQYGQVVGWKLDAAKNGTGDGFVDFGIMNIADECNRAFVNGLEHTVALDFNVDGVITI